MARLLNSFNNWSVRVFYSIFVEHFNFIIKCFSFKVKLLLCSLKAVLRFKQAIIKQTSHLGQLIEIIVKCS